MADHVEVTGTGSAGAVPDVVVLDVRVQCEAPDVAGALAAAAERVVAALQGGADHGWRSATGAHDGHGRVDPLGPGRGRRLHRAPDGAPARRDRERVGDLLSAWPVPGTPSVSTGSRLEVADRGPLVERARTAAFEDARAVAEQYADLAGRALGHALRVVEPDERAEIRTQTPCRFRRWTRAAGCRSKPASRPSRRRHRAFRAGLTDELGRRPRLVRVRAAGVLPPPARILRLRILSTVACLILVVFNAVIEVWPMVAMNIVLAAINVFFITRMLRERGDEQAYAVLPVRRDDTYLHHFLAFTARTSTGTSRCLGRER